MNDTLIFFVLAALALVVKWLTSRAENKQAENERTEAEPAAPNERVRPPRPLAQRPPPESEEERVRRFLEALGMPQGTPPPPPVRPRRVVTPTPPAAQRPKARRSWVQPLPPLVTTPEELRPPPVQPAPPPVATAPPPLPELELAVPPATLSAVIDRPTARRRAPVDSLGATLRSRGSVRRAIILREVLGPPRGLEPFPL